MIERQALIDYLNNWKNSLSNTLHDEVIGIVLDVILKKVQSFPETKQQPETKEPEWKENVMKHFTKGD